MLTSKQYAKLHETPYTTVLSWLQRGLIPGATKITLPFGLHYWQIPENAPKPQLTKGPKPTKKKKGTTK